MKRIIEENYLISIDEVVSEGEVIRFLSNGEYYYWIKTSHSEEEIDRIVRLLMGIKSPLLSHELIVNRFGKILTDGYVLIRVQGILNEQFDVEDIVRFNNVVVDMDEVGKVQRIEWKTLWEERLDFFEYQIREIGKDKKIVLSSFSYYLGLAENACMYLEKVMREVQPVDADKLVLSHLRLYYPNMKINFLNPLNYTLDLRIRDICEYLKSEFFELGADRAMKDLAKYLSIVVLSPFELHLLYARMLYPSYYFDSYEDVMVLGAEETILLKYIDKIGEYESFLVTIKKYLEQFATLFEIGWIK